MTFSFNILHAVTFLHFLHLDVLRGQIEIETESKNLMYGYNAGPPMAIPIYTVLPYFVIHVNLFSIGIVSDFITSVVMRTSRNLMQTSLTTWPLTSHLRYNVHGAPLVTVRNGIHSHFLYYTFCSYYMYMYVHVQCTYSRGQKSFRFRSIFRSGFC